MGFAECEKVKGTLVCESLIFYTFLQLIEIQLSITQTIRRKA